MDKSSKNGKKISAKPTKIFTRAEEDTERKSQIGVVLVN
jgi:hypothetical protein